MKVKLHSVGCGECGYVMWYEFQRALDDRPRWIECCNPDCKEYRVRYEPPELQLKLLTNVGE